MKLVKTKKEDIKELVRISKEAFDSDVLVGAEGVGGPPEYDNIDWHIEMMKEEHLFTAFHNDKIVGGIIIFVDENTPSFMYIGRIFVDPSEFRKGYGIAIMEEIERMYPDVSTWMLDTPMWNIRTNSFYKKLGYYEKNRKNGEVFYQKDRESSLS